MRQVEAFRWKFYDAMLRIERLTTQHLTREEAKLQFPGAVRDLTTRKVRHIGDPSIETKSLPKGG